MIRINCFLNGDRFTALSICGKRADALEIDLGCKINGTLTADAYSAVISDGKCRLDLECMPDGIYLPYIVSDGRRLRADGFKKQSGSVSLLPLSESEVRTLIKKQLATEERISRLEELTRIMSDKISHSTIF